MTETERPLTDKEVANYLEKESRRIRKKTHKDIEDHYKRRDKNVPANMVKMAQEAYDTLMTCEVIEAPRLGHLPYKPPYLEFDLRFWSCEKEIRDVKRKVDVVFEELREEGWYPSFDVIQAKQRGRSYLRKYLIVLILHQYEADSRG